MKRLILIIISIITLIIVLGMYKFNFLNDDLFIKDKNGNFIKLK